MIKDNRTFFLAFLIFILPLLGLPLSWRFALIVLFALILMVASLDFKKLRSSSIFSRDGLDTLPNKISHAVLENVIEKTPEKIVEPETNQPEDKKPIKRTVYRSRKKKQDLWVTPQQTDDISF